MARTPLAPLSAVIVLTAVLLSETPASATNWVVLLRAASTAEAQAQPAPPAPATVAASCLAANQQKVVVTWSAVSHAATYTVYKSATLAGSYTSTVSGLTTTTWTSGALGAGNVYFKVAAYFGTKWLGTQSVATGESTIATNSCVQP